MSENTAVDTGSAGDVVQFLRRQHQEIRTLLDGVLPATGEARQRAFDDVRELLARHETAEEMVVRPLTRKAPQGDQVAAGRTAEFTEFRQSVLTHAEHEETLEFPLLERTTDHDALEKARSAVETAEKMAPTHPHPSAKTTTMNYVAGPFAAMLDRARDAFSKSGS